MVSGSSSHGKLHPPKRPAKQIPASCAAPVITLDKGSHLVEQKLEGAEDECDIWSHDIGVLGSRDVRNWTWKATAAMRVYFEASEHEDMMAWM